MPDEIARTLRDLTERNFWGNVQIDFQHGQPVLIRVSETRKLQTTKENNQDGYCNSRPSRFGR